MTKLLRLQGALGRDFGRPKLLTRTLTLFTPKTVGVRNAKEVAEKFDEQLCHQFAF